jgi:hypothetical protein
MTMARVVTESQKSKIWKLRSEGYSYAEISMRTGIAAHNVAYYVKMMPTESTQAEVEVTESFDVGLNNSTKTALVTSLITSNLAREAKLHFIGLVI